VDLIWIKSGQPIAFTLSLSSFQESSMSEVAKSTGFEALDDCHRQIQRNLEQLAELIRLVESGGADVNVRKLAGAIESFFSGTSREHHAEEEKNVFPPLLVSGNDELVAAVRTLQQDHGWIEENWIELAPQLRALASGNSWMDPAEFQHAAQVFMDLCSGHIALEETLIYPESKARWAQAVANRTSPGAASQAR
jgi:hemerythrin-like domain-containing protein